MNAATKSLYENLPFSHFLLMHWRALPNASQRLKSLINYCDARSPIPHSEKLNPKASQVH
jgi:hypothetical protein